MLYHLLNLSMYVTVCFCLQESGWTLYHFLENCCSNKIPPRWTVLPHAFFKTQLIWFVRLPMGPGSHYPTVTRSDCTQKLATLRPLDPFCFLSFLVCWWEQSKRNGGEISGRGDVMWFMWFMTPQLGGGILSNTILITVIFAKYFKNLVWIISSKSKWMMDPKMYSLQIPSVRTINGWERAQVLTTVRKPRWDHGLYGGQPPHPIHWKG